MLALLLYITVSGLSLDCGLFVGQKKIDYLGKIVFFHYFYFIYFFKLYTLIHQLITKKNKKQINPS